MKTTRTILELTKALSDYAGFDLPAVWVADRVNALRKDRSQASDNADHFILGWLDARAGR